MAYSFHGFSPKLAAIRHKHKVDRLDDGNLFMASQPGGGAREEARKG